MEPAKSTHPEDINWARVRERLARAMRATEEALLLSPEKARGVMEERARRLARVPEADEREGELLQVVTFTLGNERYGLETRYIREVIPLADFTPLPGAPDFLIGVTNMRGQILAFLDLRKFFGVAVKGLTDQTRVIVLGEDRPEFGVLADATYEVTTLRPAEVLDPPETVAGGGRDYLRGVTADALLLLNGGVLLNDPRLFIDQGDEAGA
jgi:purine-binding chemotaxis protein CheW